MEYAERLLAAINFLRVAERGTLWFVKDSLLEDVVPDFVAKRKAHPCLSLRRRAYQSLQDTVPIMLGSHRSKGVDSFEVKNVMPPDKHQKVSSTYFSVVRPARLFQEGRSLGVERFCGDDAEVQSNLRKPRLTDDELNRLNEYLGARGKLV